MNSFKLIFEKLDTVRGFIQFANDYFFNFINFISKNKIIFFNFINFIFFNFITYISQIRGDL